MQHSLDHAVDNRQRSLPTKEQSLNLIHQAASESSSTKPASERLHGRPRNNIADQVVVNIDQNTGISPLVESRRARAAGSLRSTTADHYT